jgi:hypothetical protein
MKILVLNVEEIEYPVNQLMMEMLHVVAQMVFLKAIKKLVKNVILIVKHAEFKMTTYLV